MKKYFTRINKTVAATYLLFGFLFFHFARGMLIVKNDGWYVGQVNLYGDLVFHLGFINKFLESGKVLVPNPFYADVKPNYPIFVDLVTAQVARITSIDFSLFITTFLTGLLTIFVARNFIFNFVKNNKIVFLSLLLFFINGGFGFYYFFQDLVNSNQNILKFLFNMPKEYTDIKEEGYWFINTYLAYFLPQRGFLFAFPITITVLSLLYTGFKTKKIYLYLVAALLAGVLPIVQAHSLFFLFIICLFYSITSIIVSNFNRKVLLGWIIFASFTALFSYTMFNTISSLESPIRFIKFDPGWTSEENIVWFWFKNLGLFAPTLIVALVWLYKKKFLFILYLPFLFIFIISNIFVFQPWDFDNSKLLVYWYFASTIIVAFFIYEKLLTGNFLKKIVGFILIISMIFSGSLGIFRTFTPVTNYQIFSNSDLYIAGQIKDLTEKNALFVTASNHNHPIPALSGRSTLIGFHGWLWSHGLPYEERAEDVKQIYKGGQSANELISKYRVNYVVVGSAERQEFQIDESFFSKYPSIPVSTDLTTYDVSSIWANSNRQN